jgi:dihydrodipicolinate synthase/N-acetylneuraminate lyase
MSNPYWQGVFPAVTTQFHQDQTLDLDGTARHLEALIQSGIAGLIVCGSLGENQALSPREKRAVLRRAVEVARGRLPVLSGVAETSTAAACEYVRDCESLGASGFMVMPAMVYKTDARESVEFFRRVGAATQLPWMLYNNPIAYGVDISARQMAELADVRNLVAIKESSANTRRVTELRIELGSRFAVFVGVDDLILEAAVLGIDGWVAGSGIAFPAENNYFWELTRAGRWSEAGDFNRWFYPLLKLDTHVKFVQYIKLAVQEVGLGREWVREPRMTLVGPERESVLSVVRRGIENRPPIPSRGVA